MEAAQAMKSMRIIVECDGIVETVTEYSGEKDIDAATEILNRAMRRMPEPENYQNLRRWKQSMGDGLNMWDEVHYRYGLLVESLKWGKQAFGSMAGKKPTR